MKPTYNNLNLKSGALFAGIYFIRVVPREWLANNIQIDFQTGKVNTEIELLSGRSWIDIEFNPASYKFKETDKSDSRGSFIFIEVSGSLNNTADPVLDSLKTLTYHEFVVICFNKNKHVKVIGDRGMGMRLSWKGSDPMVEVTFVMNAEAIAPYYDPHNELDIDSESSTYIDSVKFSETGLPAYNNLSMQPGLVSKGFCDLKIAPREWLNVNATAGANGESIVQFELKPNKYWIGFQFTPDSYKMIETGKTNASGDYIEIIVSGIMNHLSVAAQQVLQTIRYHELVGFCRDSKKRIRVIGDASAGMIMAFTNDQQSDHGVIDISFTMDSLIPAPSFITSDNTSEDYLVTEGGDFLLTDNGDKIKGG